MSYQKPGKSEELSARIADLKARMLEAKISGAEVHTFQRVAAIMENGLGRIDGDDLIAASFIADGHG
ncbi:hypothetical protein FJV76_19165 [Mesorhizobium sp. WSM4303]|uniref:hypothetical protein n=1 Tax=unclassified Mesorhizobium TaxID=325217 RepID=UPI00115D6E2D|nr:MULTISPECIES: hypothetical protein [unclassified Mesorhizobium]TRC93108.1 hypothetical protein FJV77_23075 [Mesorhizobium sp. WSM4306]TRD02364.1 hypothetical protein FJV76_19165 [Mesorhizobium sp. WSM4303]